MKVMGEARVIDNKKYVKTLEPWRIEPEQILWVIAILIFFVGVAVAYDTYTKTVEENKLIIEEYNNQNNSFNVTIPDVNHTDTNHTTKGV